MGTASVDTALLNRRLEDIATLPGIDRLRARILTADDRALFRINPYTFAADEGLEPADALQLLLRATHASVLRVEWTQVCRGCGEYVASFSGLSELDSTFHCGACARERTTNLDEQVEVGFTVHPEIRALRFADPDTLPLDDLFFIHRFSPNILVRGPGVRLVDHLRAGTRVLDRLEPGGRRVVDTVLPEGSVVGSPRAMITVTGPATTEVREIALEFDGFAFEPRPTVAPGPVRLIVHNATTATVPVLLYHTAIVTYFDYVPFLSGQRLLNTDELRRCLRTDVIRPGTGIPSRDNTLLFSDLRGSTQLYDRIGDKAAFELVSAHLEALTRIVSECSGVVVKTIGDAVMASFSRPVDAVAAGLAMTRMARTLAASEPLILKVGIHRGPCLVVNVRDTVDYFGQTVNIAARVQGAARGGELCVTDAVAVDAGVRELLAPLGEVPIERLTLRGVGEPVAVHRYAIVDA